MKSKEEIIDKIKSDIACKRRYNWKSMIQYLIKEESFDLIDKAVTEAMEEYAQYKVNELNKSDVSGSEICEHDWLQSGYVMNTEYCTKCKISRKQI